MGIFFLVGRLLLGGYFIMAAVNHFSNLKDMTGYATSKKVPLPMTAVAVTGLMVLFGGLSIFLGVFVHVGIWVLIIFLLGVSVMMHDFWLEKEPGKRMNDMINFNKNMALVGALLMLLSVSVPWAMSLF